MISLKLKQNVDEIILIKSEQTSGKIVTAIRDLKNRKRTKNYEILILYFKDDDKNHNFPIQFNSWAISRPFLEHF